MAIDYEDVLQSSIVHLSQLLRERENTDREIRRQQNLVRALAARFHENDTKASTPSSAAEKSSPELTAAIRQLLSNYPVWFTPPMIRDMLPSFGIDIDRYREPLTSIHAILRRLLAKTTIVRSEHPTLGTAYHWGNIGENRPAMTKSAPKAQQAITSEVRLTV